MKELTRTEVDSFKIENSINLENITIGNVSSKNSDNTDNSVNNIDVIRIIEQKIISIENIFKNNNVINLDDRELKLFLNGVILTKKLENDVYRIYNKNEFIGLGIIKDSLLKRDVII